MRHLILILLLAATAHARPATRWPGTPPPSLPPSTLTPFTALAWGPVPPEATNLQRFIWINLHTDPARAAAESQKVPSGRRAVFHGNIARLWWGDPADNTIGYGGERTEFLSPWLSAGNAKANAWMKDWLSRYKKAGGEMDIFVTDMERSLNMWGSTQEHINAIRADRRFPELAALLEFDDVSDVKQFQTVPHKSLRWNAAITCLISRQKDEAIAQPVREYFPKATITDYYEFHLSLEEARWAPDANGWQQYGLGEPFGTHHCIPLYGGIGDIVRKTPDGTRPDWTSPLAPVIWQTNRIRAIRRSDPSRPHLHWMAFKGYGDPARHPFSKTPYYEEQVYHALLSGGSTNILYWNPHDHAITREDQMALNAALEAMKQQSGNAHNLLPLSDAPIPYDTKVLVSGAEYHGRLASHRLWRVTFAPDVERASVILPGEIRPRVITKPEGSPGTWIKVTRRPLRVGGRIR